MFACVNWTGNGFDKRVFDALPNRQLACYFLPNTVVFNVPSEAAFLDARAHFVALALQDGAFDFSLSMHVNQNTFGGHATYQLPANWNEIVGP
jgi:hypothetical protein